MVWVEALKLPSFENISPVPGNQGLLPSISFLLMENLFHWGPHVGTELAEGIQSTND